MTIDLNQPILPFDQLSDRDFERIVYEILSIENKFSEVTIDLMPEGKDGGKDIFVCNNSNLKVIVQCKKYKDKISKAILLEEISKFILNYLLKNKLNNNIKLTYEMWVANDFKKEAYDLKANEFNISDEEWFKIVNKLHLNYSQLNIQNIEETTHKLQDFFKNNLKQVKLITGLDITLKIKEYDKIYKKYFEHNKVVSYDDLEKYMENYNQDIKSICFRPWLKGEVKNYLEFLLTVMENNYCLDISENNFKRLETFSKELNLKFVDYDCGRLTHVFLSFRSVLKDFLKFYYENAENNKRVLRIVKNSGWIPSYDEYLKKEKMHKSLILMLKNLVLEMTRLSNYICDLLENFGPQIEKSKLFASEGFLGETYEGYTIYYNDVYDCHYQMIDIEYSEKEKSLWNPYIDISDYKSIMFNRDNFIFREV